MSQNDIIAMIIGIGGLNMRNMERVKCSVRRSLLFLIFIGIIAITTFFSLIQIRAVKEKAKVEEENFKAYIKNTAKSYIFGIDLILNMIENQTHKKAVEIEKLVLKNYNEKRNWDFSLEEFLDGTEYIDINIINNNNIISHGTNKGNINLNFNRWSVMSDGLEKIRIYGVSDIDGRGSSAITGEPMNYIFQATQDKKYIIEVGVALRRYAEKSHQTITMNNILEELMNNDYVEHIDYYDNYGTKYNFFEDKITGSLSISEEDRPYFERARDENKTISHEKKIKGKKYTEEYIPYESITEKGKTSGVIKVTYDFSSKYKLMIEFLMIIFSALCCIIIFTYAIGRKVTDLMSPIDNLLAGMKKVSMGKYDTQIEIYTNNEFEILGHNFNRMVKEIDTNKRAIIEQRDEIHSLYEEQIAISEELEQALASNKKTYFETIQALAKAIDAKDHYTQGHCHRVMEYSVAIARKMGFLECQLDDLRCGAILHDIGKIGIPESILNKNGKLTDEEFKIIKSHTSIGYDIVKDIDFLASSKNIVYEHHEKFDGTGYPEGLKGEEISIFSRIVCVADSYDAMTSNRAYRKSMKVEQAIEELEKWKGIQFDPQVVDVFVEIIKNNNLLSS
ncbi:HD domain-containing phosphohydrolase [Oceanirhabdus sp. W0125-5]|uniref:HD domain-containing phosphohydrolase n=1 Tax=Oceanirhabdus sp. W0125-5 TaxID=2999116 RepID=UPI0022F33066|nr:HD domain-containing phosphohydrolase [Oceanirhabdus sp. W0125-5]WBW96653.1 HD domain-containing protein [Oceanirhabdus sp. W0125-5]